MSEKDNTASSPSDSVSDRRFRRYHRAAERRRKAERADSVFYRAVFSIAGVGAALAIGLAVWVLNGGGTATELGTLTYPWIGPFSKLEVFGIGFIIFLAAMFFWRVRKR